MKSVGHMAVHYPVPEWSGLITSIAFPYSPPEIARGPSYRFNMNHVVEPARSRCSASRTCVRHSD